MEREFQFATASDAETVEEIQTFLEESVKDGCEGLMVKMLEGEFSHYQPSRRTVNWLKVSELHLEALSYHKLTPRCSSRKTTLPGWETPSISW